MITPTPRPPPPTAIPPRPRPPRPRWSWTCEGSSFESSRNDTAQPVVREAWATCGVYGPSCEWRDLGRGGLPCSARAPRGREPSDQRRRGLGRRARAGRGARARRPATRLARPAARRPVHSQGPDRRHALRDDLWLPRLRGQRALGGRRLRRAPAQGRGRPDRQDQHAGDGRPPHDGEPPLRHHAQSARRDSHARRLEWRGRGSARRGHRDDRPGLRRRRLDPHPGGLLRHRRPQADARARERRARQLRRLGGLRHQRPDGANRDRLRTDAGGHGRLGARRRLLPAAARRRLRRRVRRGPRAAAHRRAARTAGRRAGSGARGDLRRGAGDDHAHGAPARGRRRAHDGTAGPVRDDRARPERRLPPDRAARALGAADAPDARGRRGRRAHRHRRVRGSGGGCAARHGSILRGARTVRARRLPRAHAGGGAARRVPRRRRPPRVLACVHRMALLHRAIQRQRSACAVRAVRHDRRWAPGGTADRRPARRRCTRVGARLAIVDAADLSIAEASALIADGGLSASELVGACLARIAERDGTHSHEGDPASINAWVRVYEDSAVEAAARADRERPDPLPPLWGIPVGLKDLYAVAGRPLTASSSLLDERPSVDCDAWSRLRAQGMILLGHLHTHEFAVGGTTDQVGNPWALERSAGGSSGGSGAALAARMTPAATGTDTAGSLRIPSALSGVSTIKPTRGRVSLRGVVPLATSLDHAGPMARTLEDSAVLLAGMSGPDLGRPGSALAGDPPASLPRQRCGARPLAGIRLALSPRTGLVSLDDDVAHGVTRALAVCEELGAVLVEPSPPGVPLEIGAEYLDVLYAELLVFHRRFDDRREHYRPSLREWVEQAEARGTP